MIKRALGRVSPSLIAGAQVLVLCWAPYVATGQESASERARTLADIRQDLSLLHVEIQKLKRELSTSGGARPPDASAPLYDRVVAVETELTRLTGKTEELEHRISRIARDGANRVSDLEFRLVELEGGDISALGRGTTLGGDVAGAELTSPATPGASAASSDPVVADGGENDITLAQNEERDFIRAEETLAQGDFAGAAEMFATFNTTYPGSPLAPRASLSRGEALIQLGNTRDAARAFLDAYSTAPDGDSAPDALLKLGRALAALDQRDAACQTLGELRHGFSDTAQSEAAREQMRSLSCE